MNASVVALLGPVAAVTVGGLGVILLALTVAVCVREALTLALALRRV